MDHQPFNAGATFAFLDEVAIRFGSSELLSIGPAWDAAWLVCVASDPRHEATARSALASVVIEMDGLLAAPAPGYRDAPAEPGRS